MADKPPGRKECMQAQCWECMGHFADGKEDCESTRCPLYLYMPYRKLEPNFWWTAYATTRKGKVLKEDAKRQMTDEQRKAAGDRMRAFHKKGVKKKVVT